VSGWQQIALLAATFSGLLLTAKLFAKSEARIQGDGGRPTVLAQVSAEAD
jgi:hypothetical protein